MPQRCIPCLGKPCIPVLRAVAAGTAIGGEMVKEREMLRDEILHSPRNQTTFPDFLATALVAKSALAGGVTRPCGPAAAFSPLCAVLTVCNWRSIEPMGADR